MSFLFGSSSKDSVPQPAVQIQLGEEPPTNLYATNSSSKPLTRTPPGSAPAEAYLPDRARMAQLFDVGILRDTLAPGIALHGGVALLAYGIARATDRVAVKDVLFPIGLAANAWYSALGRRILLEDSTLTRAAASLSYVERLLLVGVSAWTASTFIQRLASTTRAQTDPPNYHNHERRSNPSSFWAKVLPAWFAPDAIAGALIALPFSAPFHHQGGVLRGYDPLLQSVAVGLFSAGFALDVVAGAQKEAHERAEFEGGLIREGVWSVVRHPDHLAHILLSTSLPLLLYASDMLNPVELLALSAPLARHIALPHVEVDEAGRDPVRAGQLGKYRADKNLVFPRVAELANPWVWGVVGAGVAGAAVEWLVRDWYCS